MDFCKMEDLGTLAATGLEALAGLLGTDAAEALEGFLGRVPPPQTHASSPSSPFTASFAASSAGAGTSLLLPPTPDKALRCACHALVKAHFPTLVGDTVDRRVRVRPHPPIKCVAVDLDNTIWDGVLLERSGDSGGGDGGGGDGGGDGGRTAAATAAAAEGGGAPPPPPPPSCASSYTPPSPPIPPPQPRSIHLELQIQLLRLHQRGVLLLSCSRNDEGPVMKAWPPPKECPLRPGGDHFVCHSFGWDAKSARLITFAEVKSFRIYHFISFHINSYHCL